LIGRSRVEDRIEEKKGVKQQPDAAPDASFLTTASGPGVHQRIRSFPKIFFKISNRTLHRMRSC
jgi:hypothetical protein